ncbi:MAG: hypothetical protein JXB39_03965 [Deltaproteobacteria bacterium]|nr:hypothetical protein [Deltaproteobacteria bacterium]
MRLSRHLRWDLLFALAGAVVVTWPLVLHPHAVLGHPRGETDNHVWMLWRAVQPLLGRSGPWANVPVGSPVPLMDPVNLPLFLPGFLVDPFVAWNLMVALQVLLGMLAAGFLARRFVGPQAAWVAMAVAGSSPFLAGVMEFGISEAFPLWLLSLHLAFLVRHAEEGRVRDAVLAGICLAGFAYSGWYHAFFGAVVDILLVPVLAWRHRRWRGLLLQGLAAALAVLPSFLYFLSIRHVWQYRWFVPPGLPTLHQGHWRWLTAYGTDLLNLLLPALSPAPISHSVYLGVVALVLGIVGCIAAPRKALPLAIPLGALLLLALGYWVRVANQPIPVGDHPLPGPALLLVRACPPLGGLSHWYRAVGPATVLLAVTAALGAERLAGRRPWTARLLAVAIVVEGIALGGTHWPRIQYDASAPAVYAVLEAPGGVVDLPFDNGRIPFTEEEARQYNRWQVSHGRPVAEHYDGRDALLMRNRLVAMLDTLCGLPPTLPPYELPPSEMRDLSRIEDEALLTANTRALIDSGFAYVVLHRSRARTPEKAAVVLDRLYGPPEVDLDGAAAWRIRMPGR